MQRVQKQHKLYSAAQYEYTTTPAHTKTCRVILIGLQDYEDSGKA